MNQALIHGSVLRRHRIKLHSAMNQAPLHCTGAAYGTTKSGVGVASMGVMRPELVMKSIVWVVMAGVLSIYGMIILVIISTRINPKAKFYHLFDGYAHRSYGLACGIVGPSAGGAMCHDGQPASLSLRF